ncbi:GDSL-type esterase/lipase family protein [Limobrevibacterium gyesilva]|uniref:GDSL-type esterase/lipase family protein n=1 Tax=Limobrevibacterium gyesilva TaxID=2991712 RepID=A0AA42CJ53_9PROT|nr:GDSL-type esterase/lipase family protein [Limobrevibacterium gyesilva]MCW3476555.1 GDSL-type esterase/lipase family protein [Limobrevibacterium gyesilva]
MTIYYSSNDAAGGFDAAAVGGMPAGWAAKVGSWAVGTALPVGAHTQSFGATSQNDGDVALLTGIAAVADLQVTASQRLAALAANHVPAIGVVLRSDASYQNCYTIVLGNNGTLGELQLLLFRRVGGSYALLTMVAASGVTFQASDTVMLRAQCQGSTISAKVWPSRLPEPAGWQVSVSDTAVSAAGHAGLYYALDGGTALAMGIDDLVVTDIAGGTWIAPDDPALLYSPYTWNIAAGAATTINAGAYLRTLFSGGSCTLTFDVANALSPLPQIWYRIDGVGAWTQAGLAAQIACAMPAATLGNADIPWHFLELVVKATTETRNRWNSPGATAVVFTGLVLASGAAVLLPSAAPLNLLVYGDSITEGVRTLGEAAADDTDRNDAMLGWAFRLGGLLGAEVGVVGFGGSGLSVTGSGNVPPLPASYGLLYQGAARSFAPAPALVVFNVGTNDGGADTVAAMTAVLNGVIAACPAAAIAVLRPFNGNQAANLQAAIAACGNPAACRYVDTTGMFDTSRGSDGLALHPTGPNNVALIAPKLAAVLRGLLGGGGRAAFRGGFQRGLLG